MAFREGTTVFGEISGMILFGPDKIPVNGVIHGVTRPSRWTRPLHT
jgi:hypothetical protein